MTIKDLKEKLAKWPDDTEIGLYEDEETAGLGLKSPKSGRYSYIDQVIEVPDI